MNNSGTELWAWMTEYQDGSIGQISALVPGIGHIPLTFRSEEVVRKMEPIARQHGVNLGQRVFLRKFVKSEDFS